MRSAAELATIANVVHLVCETDKELGTPLGKKLVEAENVNVLLGHEVVEIKGDEFARTVLVKDPEGSLIELNI